MSEKEDKKEKKQKAKTTYSLGIVILAMLVGLLIGVMTAPKLSRSYWSGSAQAGSLGSRINAILQLVDHLYVDKVDMDTATTKMMKAMLATLDPHSCYLSAEEFARSAEAMEGQFDGIGVMLYMMGDTVYINNVIGGSPAAQAGLMAGDRIMTVDSTKVSGSGIAEDPDNVVKLIRGPRHSTVKLGIQRGGQSKISTVKVRREVIRHFSVPAVQMLDKHTGYIMITNFSETTGSEFHAALLQLTKERMQNLVLDLRNNGGGSLGSAIAVADELLAKGEKIVYTEGAHERRQTAYATDGGLFETGRLAILIDVESASASEIVAGAIQDNDRGTILGHRSFGKGLVQRQFELPDGAAMLLTVARYYTPSGRCIQRPYNKGTDEYYAEYVKRVLEDYTMADSILNDKGDTTQIFHTKKGRKVYGGGGILPDVVLPYLADSNLVYYNRLVSNLVLSDYACRHLFNHCAEMKRRYPTFAEFQQNYHVDDATWKGILALADKKGLPRREADIKKYGDEIRTHYKALLAASLYGDNCYYKVMMPQDRALQRTLKKCFNYKQDIK